jgi:putative endonuclease
MLTNKSNTVLYTGVTNDLKRRMKEHKNEEIDGFTKRYHLHKLVFFEEFSDVNDAIACEKRLKRWTRAKKNALIESKNPNWEDLSKE